MTGEARAESCARALGAGLTKPAFSEKRVTKPGWDPREMGSVWACTQFSPGRSGGSRLWVVATECANLSCLRETGLGLTRCRDVTLLRTLTQGPHRHAAVRARVASGATNYE